MTEPEKKALLRKAIETFGVDSQIGMLQEECAEAIQAVNKVRRGQRGAVDHLCEEVADVLIMCEQMKVALPEATIEFYYNEKLERLRKAVDDGKD